MYKQREGQKCRCKCRYWWLLYASADGQQKSASAAVLHHPLPRKRQAVATTATLVVVIVTAAVHPPRHLRPPASVTPGQAHAPPPRHDTGAAAETPSLVSSSRPPWRQCDVTCLLLMPLLLLSAAGGRENTGRMQLLPCDILAPTSPSLLPRAQVRTTSPQAHLLSMLPYMTSSACPLPLHSHHVCSGGT